MTDRDDHLLVELLYDEVPAAEAASARKALRDGDRGAAETLEAFEATLGLVRSVPAEAPPSFLDAKILAEARRVAASAEQTWWSRSRGWLMRPAFGLAVAGATASVAAVLVLPLMRAPMRTERVVALPSAAKSAPDDLAAAAPAEEGAEVGAGIFDEVDAPRRSARAKTPPPAPSPSSARRRSAPPAPPRSESVPAPPAPVASAPPPTGSTASAPPAPVKPPPTGAAPLAPSMAQESPAAAGRRTKAKSRAERRAPPAGAMAREREDRNEEADARARMAQAFITAALQKERAGEVAEARRILARARQRARGHPSEGTVLLRHAELELRQGDARRASALARAALQVSGFTERAAARQLMDRARAAQRMR